MTIIRNMVADNLIASWTSFNNYIYEIFDMMCFIGEDSYLKFIRYKFVKQVQS